MLVIYFSGTGNSRYAAEAVAGCLKDTLLSANDCIKESRAADCASDSPFVFVSPTYAWRIPRVFSAFIESGTFSGNKKAYFIMSCGDDIGKAGIYLEKLCAEKGFDFMGVSAVVMPENYVALFDVTEESEAKTLFALADEKLRRLAELIAAGQPFPAKKLSFMADIKSRVINPIFYSLFVHASGFRVTEKCIGCGQCEKLCPLNNIKLTDGKPAYGERCTHCMACICGCPASAIDYKRRTVGKPRYYNTKSPDVTSL